MKKCFTHILLLVATIALSYYLAIPFGNLFFSIIGEAGMRQNDVTLFLAGLPISFLFWMSLYFASLRSAYKYIGIIAAFVIAAWFIFVIYPRGFYVPFVFGLLGTAAGLLVRNLYVRNFQSI